MEPEDLKLGELVAFEDGNINLHGRRLVLHSTHAFGQFRRDLVNMLGEEDARRVITRFGFFWGEADAAAMKRILEWDDPAELMRAAFKLQRMEGIANRELKVIEADPESGTYHLEIVWLESSESEEHLAELGWSRDPACWELVGHASGCATFSTGTDIYFIEKECRSMGDAQCSAVGKDLKSWGREIEPYLKFFQAEDIKGKVADLTQQLREKTEELADERNRMSMMDQPKPPFFIEGRSREWQEVMMPANRVAMFDSSVLITGETGVGKEVIARYIHSVSHRSKGSFVTVNCGALPETILESELFGHKKGAFTGAIDDRVGLFEHAAGGTILLDEIGDISQAMQLKILRVLQEHEIVRLGENRPRKIDVRVVAATNRDLDKAVADRDFREDLLYRLRVVEISVPPLRERKPDILPLARFVTGKLSKRLKIPGLHLDATTVDHLLAYHWPGNVRELENALERAAILSKDGAIRPEDLPQSMIKETAEAVFSVDATSKTLAEVEMEYIKAVLKSVDGNRTLAAKTLGIGPTTLWRRLKSTAEED